MKTTTRKVAVVFFYLAWSFYLSAEPLLAQTTNTLVNNPAADTTTRDTQSETALVLAGSNVIAAFNDSGSSVGTNKFTGFSRSTDGGASFTDLGTLPTDFFGDAGDPVLARDNVSGTIYLSTLPNSGSRIQVFRSFDNGATFTVPVNGAPGFTGGDFLDKPWIAVDNFSGTGQGNVYLVFRNFFGGGVGSRPNGIYLTRSQDGGATWGLMNGGFSIAPDSVQGAFVAVGPDHALYVFWYDGNISPRQIRMRKSTNFGVGFGPTITVATLVGTGLNGALGLNGGFRTNSFPQAAVHPVNGNIYVVYNDCTANPCTMTGADRGNIYFRQSTDGGSTWSAAVKLNDDNTTRDQWQPAFAVTPDGSHLFVGWYDRRLDSTNSLINTFGVVGTVSGSTVTFGSNFRITTQSFPVVVNQDTSVFPDYMGDYDMAVADNSFFYYTWGDNRDSNAFHANQPDVRFKKISIPVPFTFTDDPLTAQVTPVKAVHVTELRQDIDTLRSRNGLGAFTYTDPTLTVGATQVKTAHITELRTALNAVYDAQGKTQPTYTDPTITAGQTAIKKAHIEEIRSSVKAVE